MPTQVKGTRRDTTANTIVNAQTALIEAVINESVNTAEIMTINSADPQDTESTGGRAAATPLVAQTDGYGNAIPTTKISALPFYRPQAGKCAILMRPQPGDMALAVFTKRDTSGVDIGTKTTVAPGSFRNFDQSDGFLLNGFLGEPPETWLMLDPETGNISLSTKTANIEILIREEGDIAISTFKGNIVINAGEEGDGKITLNGDVEITKTLRVLNTDEKDPAIWAHGDIESENIG